jgi:two-component system chemotaxis response regulator CheB
MAKPIRVVVVDDSALIRKLLTTMLQSDPGITVVGAAPDPYVARQMIKDTNPDVVTLDVEMPKMDGLAFLEKIMRLRPMPVVMVSTLTQKGAEITMKALELGAIDFVAKPTIDIERHMDRLSREIIAKVRIAAQARVKPLLDRIDTKKLTTHLSFQTTDQIVAIGSSTGGVEALKEVLTCLPKSIPGIVITQHMPARFTSSFAKRLNEMSDIDVKEATDGERILPGHAYIAPGSAHLMVKRSGGQFICHLSDKPAVSGHKPSVDVLFRSVAKAVGARATGVILTGMGKDGAEGMLEMREAGANTFGQDEETCLVYGMPRAAHAIGAVEKETP